MRPRPATPDDYAAFVRFWHELGLDQEPLARELWASHLCADTMFLEADDGQLAAYCLAIAYGARGDVRQIAVAPAFRRRGVGRAVMAVAATKLRAAGCRDWRLETHADNVAARALYRAVGMAELRDIFVVRIAREALERFAASRTGAWKVADVARADEPVLERAFDYGAGELTRRRAQRPQLRMLHVAPARGVMQVRPEFAPGCGLIFPFRADDADVAAHLLAAAVAEPLTEPEYELLIFDRPVYDALVAAGGRLHEQMIEMGGDLPPG